MTTIRDLSKAKEGLASGHRLCAGCTAGTIVRQVLLTALNKYHVVVGAATGCLEVATTIYPDTAWTVPFIHNAFENAAATISGAEAAYRALKEKGKVDKEIRFIAFGGDGGTYDIGLQSLSGALERGHRFLYVCYNNDAYMNTGIQRSGATPRWAATTTSPAGKKIPGKPQMRKDLTSIVAAHDIPYVAQVALGYPNQLIKAVEKALEADGPSFINVYMPCTTGWKFDPSLGIEISRLAVETCVWPMYEVDNGEWRLLYKPREKKPVEEWLKLQGRFSHIFKREDKDELLRQIQEDVDRKWHQLLKRCGEE